ncbi:MAG: glycine--tRNA ligase [Acidobacteria bacterium]|nr:glycine--tRNA ligase [Acidobacteriota bacterium]MBP7473736.1 glycine--tRNA ligase [Pyrinomonadaceae bacterium]MBP9108323.1 glycine--tRNA ligase [Pyrinomonadaceae bacterium]
MSAPNIETIVSLSKRRGFVYPASDIYGGLGSSWDYGPLGVELANNIKKAWWDWVVYERDDIEGLDSSIIQNRNVWKYSGHETTFSDPMVDCRACKSRYREDKLWDEFTGAKEAEGQYILAVGENRLIKFEVPCPTCGKSKEWTDSRPFNLMFRTTIGAVSSDDDPMALAYLRPETAQGIFVNFKNVLDTSRRKLPFGIAQLGKAFRNEVTPGNFIFRTREFEQMEVEYFCRPEDAPRIHQEWIDAYDAWLGTLGISSDNIKHYEQTAAELAHYSDRTVDFLYRFFPEREDEEKQFDELLGIANRTDYDLRVHSKKPEGEDGKRINPDTTEDLSYFDPQTNERFYPYCIEPSIGVNRTLLAVLMDAYEERTNDKGEVRVILRLKPSLAPIKVAVLPLAKNNEGIVTLAKKLKRDLQPSMRTVYDDTGGIGKLYARQDEVGTPFCVTVDHESLEDNAVTVRDRDTWEQERVSIDGLVAYLSSRLS